MAVLKTLRLQLRFLLPLLVALVAAAYLSVPFLDQLTLRWFSRDLNSRGMLVANALSDSVAEALQADRSTRLKALFERTTQDERLFAIGLCSPDNRLLQSTAGYPPALSCAEAVTLSAQADPRLRLAGGTVNVGSHPVLGMLPGSPQLLGRLILLHDLSFIERRSQDTRRYLIGLITALGLVIAFITMVVAQLSWRGWVKGTRALLRGEGLLTPWLPAPELAPLATDLRARLRDLEDEYRRAQGPDADWNAERLRSLLRTQLQRRPGDRGLQPRALHPRAQRTAASSSSARPAAWSPRSSR